jgi:hypothetical protein
MATFTAPGGALPLNDAVPGAELSKYNGTYQVDVTELVTLASSDAAVASVATDSAEVIGVADGSATISFVVPAEDHAGIAVQGPVWVEVGGSNFQEVVKLVVVLVTDGSWNSYDTALDGATAPTLALEHLLEHEGESAQVLAYVYFNDGSWEDVSTEVNLTSTHEYVDVVKEKGVVGTATVAVGALLYCWPVVKTIWAPCGVPLVEAHGTAMLNVSFHRSAHPRRAKLPFTPLYSELAPATHIATLLNKTRSSLIPLPAMGNDGQKRLCMCAVDRCRPQKVYP